MRTAKGSAPGRWARDQEVPELMRGTTAEGRAWRLRFRRRLPTGMEIDVSVGFGGGAMTRSEARRAARIAAKTGDAIIAQILRRADSPARRP